MSSSDHDDQLDALACAWMRGDQWAPAEIGSSPTGREVQARMQQMLAYGTAAQKLYSASIKDQLKQIQGYRPNMIVMDEWSTMQPRKTPDHWPNREGYVDALKKAGLGLPKHAQSQRGFNRFMIYALKRGRSNNPHNARWKPVYEAHVALAVAAQLST